MTLRLNLRLERSIYARPKFKSYTAFDPTWVRCIRRCCPDANPLPLLLPLLYLLLYLLV